MEGMDRSERDNTQKAKIIFFALAALVIILLVWSFVSANKARLERDTARQEVELLKLEGMKLEQMIKDLNQENEGLKTRMKQLQAKPKPVAKKAAVKKATVKKATVKKAAVKKTASKKTTKNAKSR